MGFIGVWFYIFAAVVAAIYYVLPKRHQWIVLLAASLTFYATYGLEMLPYMAASSIVAYRGGVLIDKIEIGKKKQEAAKQRAQRKRILIACVVILAMLLVYAKAGTWIVQSLAGLFKLDGTDGFRAIAALGVSYYTFSLISYLADIYRRQDKPETNYFRLLLFVTYFPKVLQGPISRHRDLGPQLSAEHTFDYKEFCYGFQLMLWGYFKKLVIADRLALFVNTVFGNISEETGAHILVAAFFAVIQLYCDFSGCMDIAGGYSQILGLRLATNFNHPFFSKSAAEFWRRWHITLGTWFKDYVYMPLVISPRLIKISQKVREKVNPRAGKAFMTVVPLLAVWLLTGLWHGVSWNYVVWCLYWAGLIIASTVFEPEIKKLTRKLGINTSAGSWKIFQMARTFMLFVISSMLSRGGALGIFNRILLQFHPENFFDGSMYKLGLNRPTFLMTLAFISLLWVVGILQEKGSVRDRIANSNIVFRWSIYYLLIFSIMIFGVYGPGYDAASFVYQEF